LIQAKEDIDAALQSHNEIIDAGDFQNPPHHPQVLLCWEEKAACSCYQTKISVVQQKDDLP
jgi:hypothetical protein